MEQNRIDLDLYCNTLTAKVFGSVLGLTRSFTEVLSRSSIQSNHLMEA